MNSLYRRSIEIILINQSSSGAYVACPNFPTYRYCWFRDGSYSAHAMDLAGKAESSRRFHEWVAACVNERAAVVRSGIAKSRGGERLTDEDVLHTRYQLDGADVPASGWGNFQLDGLGTWLWALNQHQELHPDAPLAPDLLHAASLVADYLSALWSVPCYDCWEEHPEHVHPYTLAAIYGGLRAHSELTGQNHAGVTDAIGQRLLDGARGFGHFVKYPGSPAVDASLLGLAVPYGVVAVDDPLMLKTVEQIETTLLRNGGVHRYAADSYYGGGPWILLSAWLGWYYGELARLRSGPANQLKARISRLRRWIEANADSDGELPEQVPVDLSAAPEYAIWVKRWGPVAKPLLWSHAAYITLASRGLNADS